MTSIEIDPHTSNRTTIHPPPTHTSSPTATTTTIHIGTRRSRLALLQTDIVHSALQKAWPDQRFEIHAMSTMGDKNQTTALHDFGAKSLWTHELEAGLVDGSLDLIVHSLKGVSLSPLHISTPHPPYGADIQTNKQPTNQPTN